MPDTKPKPQGTLSSRMTYDQLRERREAFVEFSKTAWQKGEIRRRQYKRVQRLSENRPQSLDRRIDDWIEDPEDTLDEAYESRMDDGYRAQCALCAAKMKEGLEKVALGEMDWKEFFDGLSQFAQVIFDALPGLIGLCPAAI